MSDTRTGKIRRLERRLIYVTYKLSSPDVAMSDAVRNHMKDEKEALEWAIPVLRRHMCYQVDSGKIGKVRLDSPDTLEDKAKNLDILACRLRDKARSIRDRMEELDVMSMGEVLLTTDSKGDSPV